ncbi:unnamed protein product [Knipowitschia caucasica]|uniref:Glucagon-like peptide 2 receptor n=1 Tax=Knipowitschia caucasica TaxID=637954 RepID=A0AAV2MPB8_KNICA
MVRVVPRAGRMEGAFLLLPCLLIHHQVRGSLLESLISKRTEYKENCTRTLALSTMPPSGVFCNGSFDSFACWPHSSPGNVSILCPAYLPWIQPDGSRWAHRECLENGLWRQKENSSEVWREDSECQEHHYFRDKEEQLLRQSVLRLISVSGYSLSLCSLAFATLIMGVLRKLHCTRNYIHMNLFVSFMLRAAAVICKELVLHLMYSQLPQDEHGWSTYARSTISGLCKAARVCMEYCVFCNYLWLLVEAMFLHTLLFSIVLNQRRLLQTYMLLGWGTPILFVTPWTVVKFVYENTECWSIVNKWFWWIIRGPITLSVLIIFFIFIKILLLLLSKLKADQVTFSDYRYSLARATLVLVPLLGLHEVVFTVLLDECVEGSSRYARNFIHLTLSSFQGFLVAVLYCFANGEVQTELKKRWQLFLFTHHWSVRSCFRGTPLKQLWKSTHRTQPESDRGRLSSRCPRPCPLPLECRLEGGARLGGSGVSKAQGRGVNGVRGGRKSLSSSDGDMTMGETVEEVLEESQF